MKNKKSFKISDDDLVITKGHLEMTCGKEEVCQCVERALTTRLGEFFLRLNHGLDYTELKSKAPLEDRIKSDVIECVLQEERVKQVVNIDVLINRASRQAVIKFRFLTDDDEEFEARVVI